VAVFQHIPDTSLESQAAVCNSGDGQLRLSLVDDESSLLLHARSVNERPKAALQLMADVLRLVATCCAGTPGIVLEVSYCHCKSLKSYKYHDMVTASLQKIVKARCNNDVNVVASSKAPMALCEFVGLPKNGLS
jgi:hypothetical protein